MNLLVPGKLICDKRIFGESHRYAVAPVWTRFNTVQWFVWDAAVYDYENERREIDLGDIYNVAKEIGSNIFVAEY